MVEIFYDISVKFWVRSVNSESLIFGSEFVFFRQEIMITDSNTKQLVFTGRTAYVIEKSLKRF